ncbi:RHS repeat domain-containing protein, partial [Bacteroides thetaiotaomicron]
YSVMEDRWDTDTERRDMTVWLFDEESFVPMAMIKEGRSYSILTDQLGTPTEAYDAEGNEVWNRVLDIDGNVIEETGNKGMVPFLFQGQYYDCETGLAYNRFRYYSPQMGMYVSQDPIGLEGGILNLYGYVDDTNAWIDVLGLSSHGHHSDPKFMGGAPKQTLTALVDTDHVQLHIDLNLYLDTKTKVVGKETVSMRPKRGNSGAVIQTNFTRQERLEALAEFYTINRAKYPDAAADFFAQHPQLQKTNY